MALTIDSRTEKATCYRDPAMGSRWRQSVISLHDQWLQVASQWAAVNEALVADGLNGYSLRCDMQRHILRLDDNAGRQWAPRRDLPGEYVTFTRPQRWTGSAWANVVLGAPTVVGPNVRAWIQPSYTLTLTNIYKRVKIELLLQSGTPLRYRWPVSLNGLARVAWTLVSQSDGQTVAHIAKPVAWDANGRAVAVDVGIVGGAVDVTLLPDGSTVYPIVLDPTLTTQPDETASKDVKIESGNPTTNYQNDGVLDIYNYFGTRFGLIQFDVSSAAGNTVTDSSSAGHGLILTVFAGVDGNQYSVEARQLLLDWTEAGVTYNTYDGSNNWPGSAGASTSGTDHSATLDGSITGAAPSADDVHTIALTESRVQAMLTTNYGWRLAPAAANRAVRYRSASDATAGKRPQLVFEYTAGGPAPRASMLSLMGVG